jgi:hypothetical protein
VASQYFGRAGKRLRWPVRTLVPGVAAGVAMTAWSYSQRDLDAPVPLIAAALLVPLYVVVGFWTAGGRDLYAAARAGGRCRALSA